MEFHSELLQPQTESKVRGWKGPLPFYMAYPFFPDTEQERMLLEDMDYLQQLYPASVRHYQKRIADILDMTDYEGSMIYDEYPDRYSLRALAFSVEKILKKDEKEPPEIDLIQVLLFNEIYKRRHGGKRRKIF